MHSIEVTVTSDRVGRWKINDYVDISNKATNVTANAVRVDGITCAVPHLSSGSIEGWIPNIWYSYFLSDDYKTLIPNLKINCRISWCDNMY